MRQEALFDDIPCTEPDEQARDEYCTLPEYIALARRVLGAIDVDPASNEWAQGIIQATTHYTLQTNGLRYNWPGKVWLNPPYSARNVAAFVYKLIQQYETGITTEAILLVNSRSTSSDWYQALARRYHVCLYDGRISFYLGGVKQTGNSHAQAFFYLGLNTDTFKAVFSPIGAVQKPA